MNSRLLVICALLWGVTLALPAHSPGQSARSGVTRVSLLVSDLARSERFYTEQLGLQAEQHLNMGPSPWTLLFPSAAPAQGVRILRAGTEQLWLVQLTRKGRAWPDDARSNDLTFQHLALVTQDIDGLARRLRDAGARAISRGGVQTIPASNPDAGGIRALYFLDPDGHPLELIWFPNGKGNKRWQQPGQRPILGIDHTAIAVRSSTRTRAFYERVAGLKVAGHSFNSGLEQEALSGVAGARVRITGLRGDTGYGLELLEYQAPQDGRGVPADTQLHDLWSTETTLQVSSLERALVAAARHGRRPLFRTERPRSARLLDPDGHALRLLEE